MTSDTDSNSLRIFVVENHADTLRSLRSYLEQMGHVVQTAQTMEETLREFPQSNSDVLISDIGLPDGNGWEMLEKLNVSPSLFAIAVSGYGVEADKVRSRTAGYRHHMTKPADPDELDKLLDEATAQKSAATIAQPGGN